MSKQREALDRAYRAIKSMLDTGEWYEPWSVLAQIEDALAEPESARKPLTDDEINNLELPPNGCTMRELVRVVERAHGIGA